MFGGLQDKGFISNELSIIQVKHDKINDGAIFTIIQPDTKGQQPQARFMHSINCVSNLSFVVIYGGRNDFNIKAPVLSDLWIIKLDSLEY